VEIILHTLGKNSSAGHDDNNEKIVSVAEHPRTTHNADAANTDFRRRVLHGTATRVLEYEKRHGKDKPDLRFGDKGKKRQQSRKTMIITSLPQKC